MVFRLYNFIFLFSLFLIALSFKMSGLKIIPRHYLCIGMGMLHLFNQTVHTRFMFECKVSFLGNFYQASIMFFNFLFMLYTLFVEQIMLCEVDLVDLGKSFAQSLPFKNRVNVTLHCLQDFRCTFSINNFVVIIEF